MDQQPVDRFAPREVAAALKGLQGTRLDSTAANEVARRTLLLKDLRDGVCGTVTSAQLIEQERAIDDLLGRGQA